jgi:hypothetical protein
MSIEPYKIRFRAQDGRDLTPRDEDDYLAFEQAAGVLLAGKRLTVTAVLHAVAGLDGTEVPGLSCTLATESHTTPDAVPGEDEDRGVMLSWGRPARPVSYVTARAMAAVLEQACLLADAANSCIRVGWFEARACAGQEAPHE